MSAGAWPTTRLTIHPPCTDLDDAQPEIRLQAVLPAWLYRVDWLSPYQRRWALERLAWYFKRELNYDFVAVSANNMRSSETGFLWVADGHAYGYDRRRLALGGCSFDVRQKGEPAQLEWVWIHPFLRRRSFLGTVWPTFEEEFGGFSVSWPLSDAMRKFLEMRGEEWRTDRREVLSRAAAAGSHD